ncbi:unnamed protein product [Linum trigynum]|uniref:Cysteine proteinase inhibitor n=1 Tax=Linum trigynum TaxID=586398 RepID=A0AAV2C6E2_9ROSI
MATISPRLATTLLATILLAVGTAESSRAVYSNDYYSQLPAESEHAWPPASVSEHAWLPIKIAQLKENPALDAARFAVTSYNNEHPEELPLKLVSVLGGEVLAAGGGVVYHLYLAASSSAHSREEYQAFVFSYPGGRLQQLLFVPLSFEN